MTQSQTVGGMRSKFWRQARAGIVLTVGMFFSFLFMPGALAQDANIELNISPEQPALSAGSSLQFTVQATNRDTGTSWDATPYATFTTTDPSGAIHQGLYQARSAGTWSVTATYTENTVSTRVQVNPGPIQHLVVDPNSYPERLTVGTTKDFTARAYDAWNNQITDPSLSWSLTGNIGSVDAEGTVSIRTEGTGILTVRSGNVSSQVEVVGQEVRAQPVNTNSTANTDTANGNLNSNENDNTNGEVLGEEDGTNTNGEVMEENSDEAAASTCWNIHWWGWLLIMIAYFALLYGFFYLVRGTDDRWIWLGPLLLTAVALVLFFAFRCDGSSAWFPWITIIGGLLITLFRPLKFVPKNGDSL